jgi:hypothetical protein
MLWIEWSNLACELRSACARSRTFRWRSLCLAGMTVRKNLLGAPASCASSAWSRPVRTASGISSTARPSI